MFIMMCVVYGNSSIEEGEEILHYHHHKLRTVTRQTPLDELSPNQSC